MDDGIVILLFLDDLSKQTDSIVVTLQQSFLILHSLDIHRTFMIGSKVDIEHLIDQVYFLKLDHHIDHCMNIPSYDRL